MDHLIYVLWHDVCKPWLRNRLLDVGYVLLGIGIAGAAVVGMIWATVAVERVIGG